MEVRVENNLDRDLSISRPKPIAEIRICGSIVITVTDRDSFVVPDQEQIKHLHDMLCIDVKLF